MKDAELDIAAEMEVWTKWEEEEEEEELRERG